MLAENYNDSFLSRVDSYQNTSHFNDNLHEEFTKLTLNHDFLSKHRKYIEKNQLGFGDTAFHYMWFLLIKHIAEVFDSPRLLEIGVFKGQVISLWSLIALQINAQLSIQAISPLEGNPRPKSKIVGKLKSFFSIKFREELKSGNFYPDQDYLQIINNLFNTFALPFSNVQIIKGFSSEERVIEKAKNQTYSLIYIDGDHTFSGVNKDIKNYSCLIEPNGFLVMDDASYYLPGTVFWKGHESVSRACEIIPSLGFINVMNVGHNRIYQKIE